MKPIDDENARLEADREPVGPEEMERTLSPPEETVITPDLLDQLFESEDPRVQSGVADDDSDDDLDFIRMSGLTSPKASDDISATPPPPKIVPPLSPPVSFYEPGIADVDAAMMPEREDEVTAPEPIIMREELPGRMSSPQADAAVVDLPTPGDLNSTFRTSTLEESANSSADSGIEKALDGGIQSIDAAIDEIASTPEGGPQESEHDVFGSESTPHDHVLHETRSGTEDSGAREVIDLDSFNEEDVFPDLVVSDEAVAAPSIEAESSTKSTETQPEADTTAEIELVEYQVDESTATDDHDEDQTLVLTDDQLDEVAPIDDSIFDNILVDTDCGSIEGHREPGVRAAVTATADVPTVQTEMEDPYEGPATVQTYGRRTSTHHRRHEPAYPRIVKSAAVLLLLGGALAYSAYEGYRWFQIRVSNPTTLYYEAETAAASGKALKASRLFEEFVRRNPEHSFAADAMFGAGYQMQQVETQDQLLSEQYSSESLALLGEFVRRYPDHPRVGRAQSLMGIVHYRQGNYRAAVDAFIDRDAILRDPAATLPVLRTLARAYAQLGEYEAAHSTYIRAANSPSNPSPDADYDELGEMYRALAQSADTPEKHAAFQELALEHWSHAIRYPGINPTRKNAIRVKVDLLAELGGLEGTPTAIAARAMNSDVVVPLGDKSETQQATFELSEPLPFGPIVKGVPGNDDPESMEELVPDLVVEEVPADAEPQTNLESSFEVVDDSLDIGSTLEPLDELQPARYHEIAPGEQLYRIALDYGVSAADLMQWNQIEDANHIEVGQRLALQAPEVETE